MFSPCPRCGLFHSKLSCPAMKIKEENVPNQPSSPMWSKSVQGVSAVQSVSSVIKDETELDNSPNKPVSHINVKELEDPRSQQLHDHYQKLISQLEKKVAHHEAYGKKKQQERNNLVRNMRALLKEERQAKAECDELKSQLETLQRKFDQQTVAENAQQAAKAGKLQIQLENLESKFAQLTSTERAQCSKADKLQSELENLQCKFDQLSSTEMEQRARANQLETQMETLQYKYDQVKGKTVRQAGELKGLNVLQTKRKAMDCDLSRISQEFLYLDKCFQSKNEVYNELLDVYCQLVDVFNRSYGLDDLYQHDFNCKRCLGRVHHSLPYCRAYGTECRKCGMLNHFSFACFSTKEESHDFSAVRGMILANGYDRHIFSQIK